ncbi:MAG: tetratricopeptide repeat protein [Bacteroidales bacterium]|nr:tetratricopeptide repeat protein [Bacteroidales bacterium]
MFDDENFSNYDDEVQDAVKRYEAMLHDGETVYLDSEEFGMVIDHYTQLDEIDKARHAIDLALTQHPFDNTLKIKQARQYLLENEPEEAFNILRHVNHEDDDDPDFFLTLGSCLAALGKSQKAIETYMEALPFFDDDEKCELYNAIAYEYQHLNNFELAIDFYKKALSNCQDSMQKDQIYHEIRSCYFLANKKEEGVDYFQSLVDNNPYDSKAWAAIGDCYRMMFRYEDAIDPYEYALSIDPKDLWTNMHLGDIYYDLERFKEAIDTLNEALRNEVDTSMIRSNLGDSYYRLGDLQNAEIHYRKAIEQNQNSGGGWAGLGYVYSDRGESNKAIKYFEKAYRIEPFETDHLYSIAAEYHKMNDYGHALEYLNKIQEQRPSDPDAYYYIATLHGEQDHVDEAIRTLKQGLQSTNNDPTLLYLLAYAYYIEDDKTNALSTLDLALETDFEGYHEFIEYDKELLTNDIDIIDLISTHQLKHNDPQDHTTI